MLLFLLASLLAACSIIQETTPTPLNPITTPQDIAGQIDAALSNLAGSHTFSGSVLVARGDTVLLRYGYGLAEVENGIANTPQTRFRIGSLSKQFTAMAILLLQNQGKLNLQDPVCNYLTDCPADWQAITIHHLLTHTSGFSDRYAFLELMNSDVTNISPAELMELFIDKPLEFKPGDRFVYSNAGYDVLGFLIEQVSGQSYDAFLQQQIFDPLQMINTGYAHDNAGLATGYESYGVIALTSDFSLATPYAAGGLYSTVDDLYLWNQALHTKPFFPQGLPDLLFTPYIPAILPALEYAGNVSYGYGWYIGERLSNRVVGHPGEIAGHHGLIEYYPGYDVTIIVLSNLENPASSVFTLPSELIFGEG